MTTRRWKGYGLTDVGRVRRSNQDAFLVANDLGLFIVADGMGGHAGGDVASRLAIETFQQVLASTDTAAPPLAPADRAESFLRSTITMANARILDEGQRTPELRNMGTTLVAVRIDESDAAGAHVAHVGDSRAYLYRERTLRQLTQDHSVVEDFVRQGLLTREEAAIHPRRNALTRAVGIDPAIEPDYTFAPLQPGDLLLLCTDGLTKMIDDQDLVRFLEQSFQSPDALCRLLVDECNRRGGADNITVVVCTQGPQS